MNSPSSVLLHKSLTMKTFDERIQDLKAFAHGHSDSFFKDRFLKAYLSDTAFTRSNIYHREIIAPQSLVNLLTEVPLLYTADGLNIRARQPIGKVAVLLPKNGIGITAAKALASSFLMGNETIVKIPSQLSASSAIYSEFVLQHLSSVSFVPPSISSTDFLTRALLDPQIKAVVVYGDDVWINNYLNLARRTGTKVIFEGPGNDPQVVYPNADLKKAVEDAVTCGLLNGGQSCSALERFFVHETIHAEFIHELCKQLSHVKCGNPEDPSVHVGPVGSAKVLNRIEDQMRAATTRGARIEYGGRIFKSDYKGLMIVEPTVISNCTCDMALVREETFGPVFPIIPFGDNVESLIHDLDLTEYGLNASVYGDYPNQMLDYLQLLHRNVYVNSTSACQTNIRTRLIDGGYKNSGFIWEWRDGSYIRSEGKRLLSQELSVEPK
jgi:acyl-CoA reductase-like NAD-dependent aldehyde dehydrogenase